jgi:hypothetical protein
MVTARDQNGCLGTAAKTISVMDISSGKKGDKITICHKGNNELSIGTGGVADHLGHGDMLGSCPGMARPTQGRDAETDEAADKLSVRTLSNPSTNHFDLQINAKPGSAVQVRVFDMLGRIVETKLAVQPNQTLRIGSSYNPGRYIAEIKQGNERQTLTLIKER